MLVKTAMSSPAISISADASLYDAIRLLVVHRLSGLPVLNGAGDVCGVISEGDLLHRVELGTAGPAHWWTKFASSYSKAEAYRLANGRRVSDVMNGAVVTIGENASLADAASLMQKYKIKRLPVLQNGRLTGMLSRADFVKQLFTFLEPAYEESPVSDAVLHDSIAAEIAAQPWSSDCTVTITVKNAFVTLQGTVPSDCHGDAIRVAAENVTGVRGVEDHFELTSLIVPPVL